MKLSISITTSKLKLHAGYENRERKVSKIIIPSKECKIVEIICDGDLLNHHIRQRHWKNAWKDNVGNELKNRHMKLRNYASVSVSMAKNESIMNYDDGVVIQEENSEKT